MPTTAQLALDHTAYPDIIDLIFAYAPYESLLSLRTASKEFRDRIDRQLVRHVVVDGQLEMLGVLNGENYAVLMDDGHRIPRADWRTTEIAQHVKRLDVRYLRHNQADSLIPIGPVDILRDWTSEDWTRPAAKLHLMINPRWGIHRLIGPSPTHITLVLNQDRKTHPLEYLPAWFPRPGFNPAEFTVVLLKSSSRNSQRPPDTVGC